MGINFRNKDIYYSLIARSVALRSTCLDKKVGCVLVDAQGNIIATGYNGPPSGIPHCHDTCNKEIGKTCLAAHAEINALIDADPLKVHTAYVTLSPCTNCMLALLNTTCERVVYSQESKASTGAFEAWCLTRPKHRLEHKPLEGAICLPDPNQSSTWYLPQP